MDRLRAPGGCPWDASQSHASLVPYVLEEAYEVAEAIEDDDATGLREELGDLLLQVVFHAAIARDEGLFTLDDVAHDVAEKLRRRHPQVFAAGDGAADGLTAEQSYQRWDQIKAAEKQRTSVLDGIPRGQSGLARTQKVVGRATRGGLDIDVLTAPLLPHGDADAAGSPAEARDAIGRHLLALVLEAEAADVDAEGALRDAMRGLEDRIRQTEAANSAADAAASPAGPSDPTTAPTE
jgi:XTP/dITP diphosphohydrolase